MLLLTPAAEAQWNSNWGLVNQPPITDRDATIIERMLDLSEAEVELIGALREEATAEFGRISSIMQEMITGAREEFRQSRDNAVWEEVGERLDVFAERRQEIRDRFIADVQLSLTDLDPADWERVMRRLDRIETMSSPEYRFIPMGGLSVDIVEIVEEAEIDDETRASLATALDQYAREFDRDMKAMVRVREEQEAIAEELTQDGDWMSVMDELNDSFAAVRDKLVVLRDLNERYLRQVVAALPPEEAARIERAYMADAYPSIYRESVAGSQFRTALEEMEGVTEEQRERIATLQATYQREADAIREKLVTEAREREEDLELRDLWGGRRGGGEQREDQRMRELSTKFSEQLMALLTPEQKEQLPQPEGASDWRNRDFSF